MVLQGLPLSQCVSATAEEQQGRSSAPLPEATHDGGAGWASPRAQGTGDQPKHTGRLNSRASAVFAVTRKPRIDDRRPDGWMAMSPTGTERDRPPDAASVPAAWVRELWGRDAPGSALWAQQRCRPDAGDAKMKLAACG